MIRRGRWGAGLAAALLGLALASFADATSAMYIDLESPTVSGGGLGTDWLIGIEGAIGTDFNDTIKGDTSDADLIYGGDGDDTIDGYGGADIVYGGTGNDEIDGGDQNDTLIGDGPDSKDGDDTIYGGSGDDAIYGR